MITRSGILSCVAVLALVTAGGAAIGSATVASSAAADAARPTPGPTEHVLAAQPHPRQTTRSEFVGEYAVRYLVPGESLVTRDQLETYYDQQAAEGLDLGKERVRIAQDVIEIRCMADKGFYYDPRIPTLPPDYAGSDAQLARDGERAFRIPGQDESGPYDWRKGGCGGLAVHEAPYDAS